MENSWKNFPFNFLVSSVVILLASMFILSGDYPSLFQQAGRFWSPDTLTSASNVHILSYDPLILHIENFITEKERVHLLHLANPLYRRSKVGGDSGNFAEGRTSSTAHLPSNDSIVKSVVERAAEFQGFESVTNIERLQATRYEPGQYYGPHYDWGSASMEKKTNGRITTFFIILEATCTNCGTQFPHLTYNWEQEDVRLCQYVECGANFLISKPTPRSATFWRNLNEDGTGIKRTLHEGLPLSNGVKVGLNVWTRIEGSLKQPA